MSSQSSVERARLNYDGQFVCDPTTAAREWVVEAKLLRDPTYDDPVHQHCPPPLPPPALSWAQPLPSNVQIAAPLPPLPLAAPTPHAPPQSHTGPSRAVEPMQRNRITLFPSAAQRASLSRGPLDSACNFTNSRYSSNRAAVRCSFCTLRITSTRPASGFSP
ncbi:hypothetical protein NL676_032902 [Syzygium grande]|nr:hypothetical protein NL676_032902 [Syzygium grande]